MDGAGLGRRRTTMMASASSDAETMILADDVHVARVGTDLVILDARTDRYLCLPDAGADVVHTPGDRHMGVKTAGLRGALLGEGLVLHAPADGASARLWRPLAPVRRTALADRVSLPVLADLPPMGRSLADVARFYWRRPFLEILHRARVDGVEPEADEETLVLARDFHRWAPYAPTSAKCLLRSFMLLRRLHRAGRHARWVFGVRTWPFEAHCWLQCDDVVLDDEVERVCALEPILVIG